MTPDLGIEPGPHQWEASALTTAPSLHPAGMAQEHQANFYNSVKAKKEIMERW